MPVERPTFSPFWHRVRSMKPRLRPHVQITRQHYRGGRWHVVHDPASNAFYRLSPVSHEFVGLLDGRRTVEEVWDLCLTRHGDDAPTQNEVIQLLSQLYTSNLLSADSSPEVEQLLRRGRERLGKKVQQQLIGLMYFRVRLFNPERILSWLEPIVRPLLSPAGLVLWIVWVLAGLAAVIPHWARLQESFQSAIAPANWGWLIVVFISLKLIHEAGHGLICKRFGGQVPEFGAMMLVMVPAPYVDASAAWAFASKWRRIAVGAGGMLFELAIAAGAAWVWRSTPDGHLFHQLAFNAMLTSGVSTVVFNANPLMKFDGYYILSDLLETPNLMQRSFSMLKHHLQKHVYRVKATIPPTADPVEAVILNVYGVAALAYRVFLFISITLYVMGQMFALGVILAVWTAAMWFLLPLGQFAHWLATHHALADRRGRALATSLALAAAGLGLLGLVPAPDHRRASGVVTSDSRSGVFFGTDGFVDVVHKRPGDAVGAGEAILTMSSPLLESQRSLSRGQLAEAEALYGRALVENPAAAQVALERIETFRQQSRVVEERIGKLTVRAPHAGVVVGNDPALLIGAWAREGQGVCEVVSTEPAHLRFTGLLTQTEALWIHELTPEQYTVEVRRAAATGESIPAKAERVFRAGLRDLPHASLGYGGGGTVETDARDQSGTTAKRPLFHADFRALAQGEIAADSPMLSRAAPRPGERISLRFTLPSKPLLSQWSDRLQKLMQGRARI